MQTTSVNRNNILMIITSALLMLLSATQLHAEDAAKMDTPEGRAKKLTDKMKERLPITDSSEYQKVYDINLKYTKRMADAFKNADSKMAKFKAMKSVKKEKDKELKGILTKSQFKNYEVMMDEAKQQMRNEYQNRRD